MTVSAKTLLHNKYIKYVFGASVYTHNQGNRILPWILHWIKQPLRRYNQYLRSYTCLNNHCIISSQYIYAYPLKI